MRSYTSAVAYREHVLDGKATTQRQRILNLLQWTTEPLSRAGIADYFRESALSDTWDCGPAIPLASVCGRLNALIASGQAKVAKEDVDQRTGHRVEYVEAVRPTPVQKSFDRRL